MHFSYDRFNRLERPQLVLCELSKQRIGVINDISLGMRIRWTNISEVSFTVSSEMVGGGRYELFDEVRELRLVQIPNFGWFQIRTVNEISDGFRLVKECTAYSIESMLQSKQIIELEGEFRLFDPISPNDTLMGILLTKIPGWQIGNVDSALLTRWRTLNISKQNLYALLTNDVARAYECLFIFDYENLLINIVDISRQFRSTSIYLSYHNLIKTSRVNTLTDDIITALYVRGGNLDITGVNPNGTDVIYNLDYFKNRMSAGLLAALIAYENLYNSLQPTYANLLVQLRNTNHTLALLRDNPPQYRVEFSSSVDGTATIDPALNNASGLRQLESLRRQLEGIRGVRIEHGNIPYTDVNARINEVEPMITARQNSITNTENLITNIQNQLSGIVDQLRMESNFTEEQWIELNRYFMYDTFQEDSLIWTDIMTEDEKLEIQQELFELGGRKLEGTAFPKFEIRIDSVNFPALPEFEYFTGQFELGTTFALDLGHYRVNPLLLEVNLDFDDLTNFSLVYANQNTLDNGFSDLEGISANVNAANTISFNIARLEAMRRQHDDVTAFINGALRANLNELISSPTETRITINEHGLRARSFDWVTGNPTGFESWLTGSQIAFSDDFFTNARLALGRIQNPGGAGGFSFGLVGDVLIGRILAGNSLHIANDGNNFRLDETGAWLDNANFTITRTIGGVTNRIILDPTYGFSIYRGNEQQVFIGTDGNVHFRGMISGGSINIGNGAFMVDNNGNVTITRGSIDLGSGAFHVDTVGNVTITTGSIDLGNGAFIVDNLGNVTITQGSIRIGVGSDGTPNFEVNSQGHMRMRRGSISLGGTAINPNFHVDDNGNISIRRGSIDIGDGNFAVDTQGNVTIRRGSIDIGNGLFRVDSSGNVTILQGSINLGSGNFVVDNQGNMTMRRGSINLGSGNFTVDNLGNVVIRQGSINLGNGEFVVDNQGNITIRRGSINLGNGTFVVNSQGHMTMTRGSISLGGVFNLTDQGHMTMSRGSINLGNGQFIADDWGNVTMWRADIRGGRMRLGNTEIDETMFQTTNGRNSSFFNSNFDSSNNVHGGAVMVGTLHADRIMAGSITAQQIQAGSITALQIQAGSITGDRIAAGTITANQIAAHTITGNQIAANSITAEMISAGTLNGMVLNWAGGMGSLSWTTGFDGNFTTNLIHMHSSQGMRIEATGGGINMNASGGMWLGPNAIWINTQWGYRNLRTLIEHAYSEGGISNPPSN